MISQLGEGGFGIVWLAERRVPFVQRVALKILKAGMDSKFVLARSIAGASEQNVRASISDLSRLGELYRRMGRLDESEKILLDLPRFGGHQEPASLISPEGACLMVTMRQYFFALASQKRWSESVELPSAAQAEAVKERTLESAALWSVANRVLAYLQQRSKTDSTSAASARTPAQEIAVEQLRAARQLAGLDVTSPGMLVLE